MQESAGTPQAQEPDMDGVLAEFEARCDRSDPDQLAMLEQMRAHTRRLHQQRGDWNKPNTRRNCNSAAPRTTTTAPKAIAAYRDYKQHVAKETAWQQLQQQRKAPMLALLGQADQQALPAPPQHGTEL
ncbi:hypothetical protein D9Q98_009212 [Chlorella vulgaris]|uniref:Uncharacterized protein n=1 Tax=Chlorella vulgaris TaxID=3077 RepID=A0A9D4TP09_CHLVU|nr:hypothetical protein D9Q98_009212 [Chlorella vulgaris]